jgi:1-phosphofructokinase family hexose kinase
MFLCISPNPAIDKRLIVDSFVQGHVHRVRGVQAHPGGKAAHVAMTLRGLGESPVWIGFSGGASGSKLISGLRSLGICAQACPITGETRVNVELLEDNGRVTEILEPGPAPSPDELQTFEKACENAFVKGGEHLTVIFSGSLPAGVAHDFYARLVGLAHQSRCRTFLDTSGEPLRLALAARPHFVKPNREEASRLLGLVVDSLPSAINALRQLLALGATSAALSLGSDGLLFCPQVRAPVYFAPALPLSPRSAVGCGDAALAGFASAFATRTSVEESLRLAAACAAANCVAPFPGAVRPVDIQRFQQELTVRMLPECP